MRGTTLSLSPSLSLPVSLPHAPFSLSSHSRTHARTATHSLLSDLQKTALFWRSGLWFFFLINFFKKEEKKLPKMTKGQTGVFKVQDVPIFFFNSFKFLSKKHFKKLFGKLTNYFKGRINSFPHMWWREDGTAAEAAHVTRNFGALFFSLRKEKNWEKPHVLLLLLNLMLPTPLLPPPEQPRLCVSVCVWEREREKNFSMLPDAVKSYIRVCVCARVHGCARLTTCDADSPVLSNKMNALTCHSSIKVEFCKINERKTAPLWCIFKKVSLVCSILERVSRTFVSP